MLMPQVIKILPLQTFLRHHHPGRSRDRIRQRLLLRCMCHPTSPTSHSLPIHTLSYSRTAQYHPCKADPRVICLRPTQKQREPPYLTTTQHRTSLTWNLSLASPPFHYKRMLQERNFLV